MENRSGEHPVEFKVLVMPDQVDEKSEGGIIKPGETHLREALAQTAGVLIEKTDLSFSFGKRENGSIDRWCNPVPQAGQRVRFRQYAGIAFKGKDGKQYRVMNDKDVVAIIGD